MSAPRVSVIIATYNRSAVLRHAVASVLAQTFTDFELLVVGDGCTDDSASAVASFGDPRIRWFNLAANSGHQSTPNNEGLRQARGELIAYLGHDDLWLPHHLQVHTAGIDAGCDLCATLNELIGPDERVIDLSPPAAVYHLGMSLPPSSLAHKREVSERIGGWRDYRELPIDPEADFCQRAVEAGFRLRLLPRLTAVKFPAAWRRNVYRRNTDEEQAAWLRRIQTEPDFEECEMARLAYAGKEGRMLRMRPLRLLLGDVVGEGFRRLGYRLRTGRILLAGKGARVNAARQFKGLDRRR